MDGSGYKIFDLKDAKHWSNLLSTLPLEQQDIYFTPEYYRLYENYGDGKALCFVYEKNGDIALYPFLINSVNDLGYDLDNQYYDIQGAYGYNGIVSSSYTDDFVFSFYQAFNDFVLSNNIIAEFIRFHPIIKNDKFSHKYLDVLFDRMTVYIDLKEDYSKIFNQFQSTTRKQIRRATNRYSVKVEVLEKKIDIIETFMRIYHHSLKRIKSDDYLYFNDAYIEDLILTTPSVCFCAFVEDRPIASIIAFYNDFYIHGHLGGALTEFLSMSPYSFLYSEMIKFGQKKGCKILHVGGGATNKPSDSLLKFKLNFSRNKINFFIGKKVHNQITYRNVVQNWEGKYPEKKVKFGNFLLKYRY
jgi:hypothetical protein